MATRSTISIQGFKPIVYKHWDGNPEAMLPWLTKFNKQFTERRGIDPHYKMAQLLRSSVLMRDEFALDASEVTGYGVFEKFEDIGQEYNYLLLDDGSVTYTRNAINPNKKTRGKK